ncbi:hypothetical protein ACPA2L_31920 [Bacillus bombysepticus]
MSLYEKLPNEVLAGFFIEINKNIEKGILSTAMYGEVNLMIRAAQKRNLSEEDLQRIYQKQKEAQHNQVISPTRATRKI